jgi:hypothetical protein
MTVYGPANSSGTTCVVTITGGASVGDGMFAWAYGTTTAVTAIVDSSLLNTWNFSDNSTVDASDGNAQNLGSVYVGHAVASSGTVTMTVGVTSATCYVAVSSKLASSSWLNKTANNATGENGESGTTATTTTQPNINIAAFVDGTTLGTVAWPWPWQSLATGLGQSRAGYFGWEETTALAAQSVTITAAGGSDNGDGLIGSYTESSAVAGCTPRLALLGVGC